MARAAAHAENFSPDIDACDDAQSLAEYGRLYNWYAVDDARGLCPVGWHVPTDGEWTELEDYITSQGFAGTEGTALKSTTGWGNNGNGTDDFGFSALPGGNRNNNNGNFNNFDGHAGNTGSWWSSSPNGGNAWYRDLIYYSPFIARYFYDPRYGFSVRCLRDAEEVQGCTDPDYIEYDTTATADDGSCLTLVVFGCTDSDYLEYNASANTDDGSCLTLLGCSDSDIASMDGYDYEVVTIGDQCWFAENLRTTTYADGSAIPEVTDNESWTGLSTGARCDYGNDVSNPLNYGRLYNWYAVTNGSGLCPSGWHVPTHQEWTAFETYLSTNCQSGEGGTLKSTSGWDGGGNGSDTFGFSALPGGNRANYNGLFYGAGFSGYWWSSSISGSGSNAWFRSLLSDSPAINWDYGSKRHGFSVRCLRDAVVNGCTDPAYTEYDALANTDDGSCTTPVVNGCIDPAADNYNAAANTDDGSCLIPGCMNAGYTEYNAAATYDDGSCATAVVNGCTDPAYTEYDASANTDDGSCTTPVVNGCTDPAYTEYDASANTDDGSCTTPVVNGCTDPAYTEYDASANTDDGSCLTLLGCSDSDIASMDGYDYEVVTIGDQCWFAENLRTTTYADGSAIPGVTDNASWYDLSTGARCDYDNDASDALTYGRLYNWYAVNNGSGLCPSGWHVPTDGEWTALETYLGANGHSGAEGTALKSTSGWNSGGNGTDNFGFSALPGGNRDHLDGRFGGAGFIGYWWSSSPNGGNAWARYLYFFTPGVNQFYANPRAGFSVRCLRDAVVRGGCTDPAYTEYDASANSGRWQLRHSGRQRLHRPGLYRVRCLGQHGRWQLLDAARVQ